VGTFARVRAATRETVESFWARLLGVPREGLLVGRRTAEHALLGTWPGVFVVGRQSGCHVSAPEHLLGQVEAVTAGASDADLLDGAWWLQAMGPAYEVRGPNQHLYLDHTDLLAAASGSAGARIAAAGLSALDALRRAVGEADWQESGFDEDPRSVFVETDARGEVVAAANLTDFDDKDADVGVLTRPAHRGRGHGRAVAAAASGHAVTRHGIARWVANVDNAPSLAIARSLGYRSWCRQLAVRPVGA
jgi:RimJ/RimL family protein N-acetyltransferase